MNIKTGFIILGSAVAALTVKGSPIPAVVAEWDAPIWGETANREIQRAQTFEPTQGGTLSTITVFGHGGTAPDIIPIPTELTLTVYDIIAPFILSPLASETVDTTGLTALAVPISASFTADNILLTAGHKYAFGLQYPTAHNELLFFQISETGYTGGAIASIFDNAIFEDGSGLSLRFQVTALTGPITPTPDSTGTGLLCGLACAGLAFARFTGLSPIRREQAL